MEVKIELGKDVKLAPSVRFDVTERLVIGDRSVINEHVRIQGRDIVIGREAWLDEYAFIGGGSCFEKQSSFRAGDFLHMGSFSGINTARSVEVGDECGIGVKTRIHTHGAYTSEWEGFPVKFAPVTLGNRVWLPNAWVNPGVTIGDDVVVAAMSLVNRNLPPGCLAGGIPVRIIKEDVYPKELTDEEKEKIAEMIASEVGMEIEYTDGMIMFEDTVFDVDQRCIVGTGNTKTERLRNQLRRHGIRFKYMVETGEYVPWDKGGDGE